MSIWQILEVRCVPSPAFGNGFQREGRDGEVFCRVPINEPRLDNVAFIAESSTAPGEYHCSSSNAIGEGLDQFGIAHVCFRGVDPVEPVNSVSYFEAVTIYQPTLRIQDTNAAGSLLPSLSGPCET